MAKSLPPLGWLRTFECAGRLLSFTLAADELGLTQSAVSQQIRSLEHKLSCRLFLRKHRGIALTDAGRRLLPDVSQAINSLEKATASFEQPESADVLTVAASVSVAQWYLVPRLRDFLGSNPGARVRIITTVWPDEFADTTADVEIRFGPVRSTERQGRPLGANNMVLVASPALLTKQKNKPLDDDSIKLYPLIQAVGTADIWSKCAPVFGMQSNQKATLFVDSHGLAVDFAIAGNGIALTSELIAAPCLAEGTLQKAHPTTIAASDGYFFSHTGKFRVELAAQFEDWLFEQIGIAE